jgi:hypothetical protein
MQRLRTNANLLLFIFGANLVLFIAPTSVASLSVKVNNDIVINQQRKAFQVVRVSDITKTAADDGDDKTELITYQSINHASNVISDEDTSVTDSRLYEITVHSLENPRKNFIQLISTISINSCHEGNNTSLPAWKIDKSLSEGKFRLKINHAKELAWHTLYLCVFDDDARIFRHLGENSLLKIDDG